MVSSYSNFTLLVVLIIIKAIVVNALNPQQVYLPVSAASNCNCSSSADSLIFNPPARFKNGLPRSREIVLTGFFSFTCSALSGGPREATSTYHLAPAAVLAVEEINNSEDILQDYLLVLDVRDSQCSSSRIQYELANSVYFHSSEPSVHMGIVGPGCSTAETEAIAGIAGRFVNLSMISYGYNSPIFGDKDRFPAFYQTARSIDLTMRSALGVLDHFNWKDRVAFIYEATDTRILTVEGLLQASDVNDGFVLQSDYPSVVVPIMSFTQVLSDSQNTTLEQFMSDVRSNKVRVILAFLSEQLAVRLLCKARDGVIPGDGFVFVFVGTYSETWWTDTKVCTLNASDVESVLVVSSESINSNVSSILESGKTVHDFKVEYTERLRQWCPHEPITAPDPLTGTTYDAVWSLALAINNTLDILNSVNDTTDLEYDSLLHDKISKGLNGTRFSGVSGIVQFDDRGERQGADSIFQIQNGYWTLVAHYDVNEGGVVEISPFVWFGKINEAPSDIPRDIEKFVPLVYLITSAIFTIAGIIFACAMWLFNWKFSRHKILRASSQKLNYVIIIGVIVGYITVLILTILESPLGQIMGMDAFKALCVIRVSMLPIAFTLTYGTLFARAWRIYRVFNNPWASARPLKDRNLMLMVAVFLVIDLLYLIPWAIIDPYRQFDSPDEVDYDSFSRCVFVSCSSTNLFVWLGILGAYKLGFIFTGSFIVSLVRQKVREKKIFDDSQALAIALYVSAIAFLLGLALTFLFLAQLQVTAAYVVSAVWVNVSSSGTLVCVFIPKLYNICIKKESGKKYKSVRSVFYLAHPSMANELSTSGSVRTVGSLSKRTQNSFNHPGFGDMPITEEMLQTIQGTEDLPAESVGNGTSKMDFEESIVKERDDPGLSESLKREVDGMEVYRTAPKLGKVKSVSFDTPS